MASIKRSLKKLGKNTQAVALRTTDKHLRLAVTGLAGAGKTAFSLDWLINYYTVASLRGTVSYLYGGLLETVAFMVLNEIYNQT